MSQFVNSINKFSSHYNVSQSERFKLLASFPLFRMYWYSRYGRGILKDLCRKFFPIFKSFQIKITIFDKNKKQLSLPIKFDEFDLESFREIFLGGEYNEILKIKDIKTIFDVGANTGMASLFFLANTNLHKLVLIEANPSLAENLKKLFNDERVIIENRAVYGERGTLRFQLSDNHRVSAISNTISEGDSNGVEVETLLVSDIIDNHKLTEVDLLKMDIEGAEHSILEKTPEVFLKFKYIYLEIHGDKKVRDIFRDKLIDLGFKFMNPERIEYADCETSFFKRLSN